MRIVCEVKRPANVMGKTRKAVIRLIRELFLYEAKLMHEVPPNYNFFHLDKWLEGMLDKAERCLIARVNDQLVGVLLNERITPTNIRVLYVQEKYRGKSIGEALVGLLKKGCSTPLSVECLEKNIPAIQFYQRQGFVFDVESFEVNGCNNVRGVIAS